MPQLSPWIIQEDAFEPSEILHKETIFTIGNGYLSSRGAFEEGYPGDHRATFVHGVFDQAPVVFTELANVPDWLPLTIYLEDERFSLDTGVIASYQRSLDLRTGLLRRQVRWQSPQGRWAEITIERFTSLANPHLLFIRCQIIPEFNGTIELRASLKGDMTNEGLAHWFWIKQGLRGKTVFLLNRTRHSKIELASTMRFKATAGSMLDEKYCDAENTPVMVLKMAAQSGQALSVEKYVAVVTSRDTPNPVDEALLQVNQIENWSDEWSKHSSAWEQEWERADVVIEGDEEAQIAMRFNLFQMLIAAPRQDERVNIGAKTLSGFGYRGHCFWDTEIFMLPLFTFTSPLIARNLLNYRYHNLAGARKKAQENGYEGAQFPWESADSGEEVTPRWVPDFYDPTKMVRIWTGDIEIHISADIAYAAYQYWLVTGDHAWFIERGSELILDTAKFWASRAEWNPQQQVYEYKDVIGPDEYHEHVDNNAYTNRMAQWNLQTGLQVLKWLEANSPGQAEKLSLALDLTPERLSHWQHVIDRMHFNLREDGLLEQFDGYYQRKEVDLAAMEPRSRSVQVIFGIQGTNETQVLKQPDVVMLPYLLRGSYSPEQVRINYDYYTPRTDHTYGSSLGPSIQAIMACEVGKPDEAYEHFIRAARADLRDVRGNAVDGIHAASAAGTWQAVVFGFGGLHLDDEGWHIQPRLPIGWKRLAFKFYYRGEPQVVDIRAEEIT